MTTTLIAKPVVKDQFWVITDGGRKVGNVIANGSGFEVKVNGTNKFYKDRRDLKKTEIEFQTLKTDRTKANLPFASFPTTTKVFNSMFDIKRRLHLYTKTLNSKCYYAAGWFVMAQHGAPQVVFCPKYIFIQRYNYMGPFKTADDAKTAINSL